MLCKKRYSQKFTKFHGKNTGVGVCYKLYLKETPTQVFSSEICGIVMSSYFEEYLRTTASALPRINLNLKGATKS